MKPLAPGEPPGAFFIDRYAGGAWDDQRRRLFFVLRPLARAVSGQNLGRADQRRIFCVNATRMPWILKVVSAVTANQPDAKPRMSANRT